MKNTHRNSVLGFIFIFSLGILLIPAYSAQAATPTPTHIGPVKVIVHLLDASNQPLAGVNINLLLNRYGDTIEEIQAGSCITDTSGSCSITVDDPPRLRSGKIEGFIDLGSYGRQLIGWKRDSFEITLQLYPEGKLATLPAPLDAPYEGQTQQPTDAPLSTATRALKTTATPIATATAFLNTATHTPPTVTVPATTPVTLTLKPTLTQTPIPPTPIPPSHSSQRSGWAWIGLGLALFAGLGTAFAIYYQRQYKRRKSD